MASTPILAKELIGHVGTKRLYTFLLDDVDGRADDLFLLRSLLRIQCQNGNTRVGDTEVTLQTLMEDTCLIADLLNGNGSRHILQGQMGGNKTDAHHLAHHHRQRAVFLWLGVDIEKVLYEILLRTSHRLTGSLSRLIGWLSELHLHIIIKRSQQVQPSVACLLSTIDGSELCFQMQGLAMEGSHLG